MNSLPYVRFSANHTYPGLTCYGVVNNQELKDFIISFQKRIQSTDELEQFYSEHKEWIEEEDDFNELISKLNDTLIAQPQMAGQ